MFKAVIYLSNTNNIKKYILISLVLHFIIIVLLITNVSFIKSKKVKVSVSHDPLERENIVKAKAVTQKDVTKELARINKIEQQKKRREELARIKVKKAKEELARVKKQKLIEAKKLKIAKEKARNLKEDMAKKEVEKKRLEQDLQEKLAKKREKELKEKLQNELLAKIKKQQEKTLKDSLLAEEKMLSKVKRRSTFIQKEFERYIALQQAKVSRNWIARESFLGRNLATKLEIRLTNDGKVISVRIVQPSGDQALDISAKNAILKASPLPVPEGESLRRNFVQYRFTFRPDELS